MKDEQPSILERIIDKEEIQRNLTEYDALRKEFQENYSDNYPSTDPEGELREIMELHELLKEKVFERLFEETIESDEKIKNRDLKQIVDYVVATMTDLDAILILSVNYCNRCGLCCKKPSPIVINPEEYLVMTNEKPELINDIEPDFNTGGFKFIEDQPCKFFDNEEHKCKIYDIRPTSCRTYPVAGDAIVGAGDCEYMVRYTYEKCHVLLKKGLRA